MGSPTATVIVKMLAKPGKEVKLKKVLCELIRHSVAEPGCLDYFMHQSKEDSLSFMLFMNWKDEESFQRHASSPSIKKFDNHWAGELLSKPFVMTRWTPLG